MILGTPRAPGNRLYLLADLTDIVFYEPSFLSMGRREAETERFVSFQQDELIEEARIKMQLRVWALLP